MRRTMFAALALATLAACVGTPVRMEQLLPQLRQMWPNVERVIEMSPEFNDEVKLIASAVGDALAAEDLQALARAPIAKLFEMARAGVDEQVKAGKVSPGLALSYYELLRMFEQHLDQLLRR